jgi:hypothetical protein
MNVEDMVNKRNYKQEQLQQKIDENRFKIGSLMMSGHASEAIELCQENLTLEKNLRAVKLAQVRQRRLRDKNKRSAEQQVINSCAVKAEPKVERFPVSDVFHTRWEMIEDQSQKICGTEAEFLLTILEIQDVDQAHEAIRQRELYIRERCIHGEQNALNMLKMRFCSGAAKYFQ